jgi:hypothetical protein
MKRLEKDHCLFISFNPTEHVAVTRSGNLLDNIAQKEKPAEDLFLFFANEEGSLLRIREQEYEILKKFSPQSPLDEELKRLVSEYFLSQKGNLS